MKKTFWLALTLALSACGPVPKKWTVKNLPKIGFGMWVGIQTSYEDHIFVMAAPHADFFVVDPHTPAEAYCPVTFDVVPESNPQSNPNRYLIRVEIPEATETYVKMGALSKSCTLLSGTYWLKMTNPFVGKISNVEPASAGEKYL